MAIDFLPRTFSPDHLGIPTAYEGVQFRSRLEARWAAFFDLAKWPWSYEPIDLAGYIPDFVVSFSRAPVLVEVKPALDARDLLDAERKLCMSGWRGDYLLVGARMFDGALGLMRCWESIAPSEWGSVDRAEAHRCLHCGKLSVHHGSESWACVVCGAYDGNAFVAELRPGELEAIWREAGNRVQWVPGGAKGDA